MRWHQIQQARKSNMIDKIRLINSEDRTPNNCEIVNVLTAARFKHYKEGSSQFKRGIKGRWQAFNGYGWDNIKPPEVWIAQLRKEN